MATIKEAVRNASALALETLGADRAAGLQLEEVESANIDGQRCLANHLKHDKHAGKPCRYGVAARRARLQGIHGAEEEWRRHFHENPGAGHDVMLDAGGSSTL